MTPFQPPPPRTLFVPLRHLAVLMEIKSYVREVATVQQGFASSMSISVSSSGSLALQRDSGSSYSLMSDCSPSSAASSPVPLVLTLPPAMYPRLPSLEELVQQSQTSRSSASSSSLVADSPGRDFSFPVPVPVSQQQAPLQQVLDNQQVVPQTMVQQQQHVTPPPLALLEAQLQQQLLLQQQQQLQMLQMQQQQQQVYRALSAREMMSPTSQKRGAPSPAIRQTASGSSSPVVAELMSPLSEGVSTGDRDQQTPPGKRKLSSNGKPLKWHSYVAADQPQGVRKYPLSMI